ncbi:MAG: hypothetical protein A4E49_01697 [Methanosaeta sp. PtaU1.Bin112]|nr:MAG: hypothetical protein A4E49_01697 [Methanosaeta sp. PtaU1.Bin112]
MAKNSAFILLLLLSLIACASGQGYMGTVSTGTGIIPALTVGKNSISATNVGSLTSQANLTGGWSLDLKGDSIRHIDLQMYQQGDLILGAGQLSSGQAVTAAGSVSGDRPTIFISVIDAGQAFRLKLSLSGESLAGEYDCISQAQSSESGTATGRISFAVHENRATALGKSASPSATAGAWVGKATQSINK